MSKSRFLKSVGALFFPPKCIFCGALTEKETVCPKCVATLPYYVGTTKHREFFTRCAPAFHYAGAVRESILRFKFGGRQSYAAAYAVFTAEAVKRELDTYDIISWTPVSKKRKRSRGYDQAELLAKETAKILGKDAVCTLEKMRDTPKQSGINAAAKRRANVMGAYKVVNADAVRGKTVLLMDDIVTTGATLSECARELLMAGAKEVVCAVIAAAKED